MVNFITGFIIGAICGFVLIALLVAGDDEE